MANEIEIIVTSKDKSGPGFAAAKNRIRELEELADRAGTSAEGMGDEFADAGQKAASETATATDRVQELDDEVEKVTKSTSKMRDEFGRFKKTSEEASESTKKSWSGLPDWFGGVGAKARSAYTRAFTNSGDVEEHLPKLMTNPAVLAAAVPAAAFVGAAMGGALVLGFGAGIASIGMVAAAGADDVQKEISELKEDIGNDLTAMSAPFRETFMDITDQARQSFSTFKPALGSAFRDLAPVVSDFTGNLFRAFTELEPAIDPLSDAFSALLQDLGPRLPGVMGGIADSMTNLAESIEKNPAALGRLIEGLGKLAEFTINDFAGLNDNLNDVEEELQMIANWFDGKGYKLDIEVADKIDRNIETELGRIVAGFDRTGEATYEAKTATEQINAAFDVLADSASDVAERGNAIISMLDTLSGRTPDYEESVQSFNDHIREIGDLFSDVKDRVNGYGDALLNADGTVNTITENGSKLQDVMVGLQSDFANSAAAVRDLEDAGWSHDAAVNKVNGDLAAQRDALLATGEKMGLTKAQMELLLAAYGLTPKNLDTLARLDDADARNRISQLTRPETKNVTVQLWYNDPGAGRASGNGWGVGGIAHGGIVGGAADGGIKPGLKWVGEQGPELVRLPAGSQVIPSNTSRNMVEQSRNMFQGYEDSYNYGDITDELWKRLMDQGWRGDPTDRAERIYKPGSMPKQAWSGYNDSYDYGEITDELWERLKSQGWKGNPNDGAERIYKPSTRSGGQGSSIGGGGRTVLEIRSGGSRLDDLLVELLRKAVQQQGGDVQTVLGGDRW